MQRSRLTILMLAVTLTATTAHAAEIDVPPPVKPSDLPVQANQPNCTRWTDDCVTCTRGIKGMGPACSNIGVVCQPKAIRCIGTEHPEGESAKQ